MPGRPRLRGLLALTAVSLGLVASGAVAAPAPAVACQDGGARVDGSWQRFRLPDYRAVDGVDARRTTTAHAVDPTAPFRVVVTDGTTVQLSDDGGCAFREVFALEAAPSPAVPLSGARAEVVAVTVTDQRRVLLLVREGTGAASRPHVVASDRGERGTWALADAGLPDAGTPVAATAAPGGRTVHLALRSAAGAAPVVDPVGLVTSRDGGRTWARADGDDDLPGPPDVLAADRVDPDLLWVVSGGRLHVSQDGGRSLVATGPSDVAVDALAPESAPGRLVLLGRAAGRPGGWRTEDGGRSYRSFPAPAVTSAAARASDPAVVLVTTEQGRAVRVPLAGGRPVDVTPSSAGPVRDVASDRTDAPSWSAVAGDRLLRWVDPVRGGPPVLADGLDAPPPPVPARVTPARREVELAPGQSAHVRFDVALPAAPTPLDLVLLVDNSDSMGPVLEELRAGLREVARTLAADGLDLRIGLATAGSVPRDGRPEPVADPRHPEYRRPVVYERLAAVRPPDAAFFQALARLEVQTPHPDSGRERLQGQLLAVHQLLTGEGVRVRGAGPAPVYDVPPGQVAGWRQSDRVRRLLVDITDQELDAPPGTPVDGSGRPAIARMGEALRVARIVHVGFTNGPDAGAQRDLGRLSAVTGALAPPAGLDCDGDGTRDLEPGAPLVCPTATAFTAGVLAAVRALPDVQPLSVTARGAPGVLRSVSLPDRVDVVRPARLRLVAQVGCPAVAPGTRHDVSLDVRLRGVVVGRAGIVLRCSSPPAALPPADAPAAAAPAGPPAAPAAPAAVVPPAAAPPVVPAAAPAPAVQGQAQGSAQYGAVEQEQDAVQPALVGVLLGAQDEPAPAGGPPWQLLVPAAVALATATAVGRRERVLARC